jgi:flagellar basal-body rod modification protein FlgD
MSATATSGATENYYVSSRQEKIDAENQKQQDISKDDFMELLMAEMTNQDPLEPLSNEEYMGQMAQLQSLESTQNMETLMKTLVETISDMKGSYSSKLDTLVENSGDSSLAYSLETMRLESQVASASQLIGRHIEGLNESNLDTEGTVKSVVVEGAAAYLILDNDDKVSLLNVKSIVEAESE